ncbi:MAG: hypothetical protein A2Z07_01985 [Armatimonadetes bacterium RBG_16_67_12]|nr:MAG: hypothetical protein A2Z07_01985 [Armatimonadetes bacterium RBG_16_67_12]
MEPLSAIAVRLDAFFRIEEFGPDPSFSRYIPQVYEAAGVDWQGIFEPEFVRRFNGLMLKGGESVGTVFCSVFPAPEVLDAFIERAAPGDMLFLHHPLDIECGDPLGPLGRGFLPIAPEHLDTMRAKGLSFYACHAPMDTHPEVGTAAAIARAIGARIEEGFWPDGDGHAGLICAIEPMTTHDLIALAKHLFDVTFVDFAGRMRNQISKVAIVAGAGYKVAEMRGVEAKGAQAYLTGEILDRIDNDDGRRLFREVEDFARGTTMSLIGVSHAASEYLVMKTQMIRWLKETFAVDVELIPLNRWWR